MVIRKIGKVKDVSDPSDSEEEVVKGKEKAPKVWDLLGQPSGKFDYKVKHTPPLAYVKKEDIILSRSCEEFDEEDIIVTV